ncbi:MAG: ATP-dependent Clp protease ATP-binding subunit ClpA [Sulfurimonas sp. RIFCSPLOWO2_12_FULL_36_74]|uniref:ATP-dependent Clp protease ATP-binding subunit ClpA n=1 Tax=Sulfurimonas sp. RIFCSPLOWO2_12_36_12 TaxID=1802253 RepID=UPI0008B91326|nr:ATP-dependent Clp protease ATP-binding subunit ClpA [Sulfurimonas sp. RIFCSPLOWO2_12_36_12]OHE00563.1 MAG: ATP-dependent Clp protease ATP-binding subunit ClpA [Sulfurimonas sp. RIFCSPLOWO2_02_FULL_36_28]OHE01222.1 MAG: ATP-dependent Clp protease ATP-binding subunit ClpA [Sulfurimonas sp. RIFCSPLOWO2_12_36_12]OHE02226.1 MAG: ATP-dependent Clp protease ATP-binding subunit ClpA [Sulfurimonas sp. RIFCSPLOWO2_12_FULL_36_74]
MISQSLNEVFQKSIIYAKELKHEYITIEHIFYQLLNSPDGAKIIFACGGDVQKMKELIKNYIYSNISTLPQDINEEPFESVALSRLIDRMVKHIQSSGQHSADIGDLLVAIYDEVNSFAYMLLNEYHISKLDILETISHTDKQENSSEKESYLQKYSINLLKKAKEGKIDPVIGREDEIERVTQILCRRKKNNPILVGEAGVGKTAIAEGLALNIVAHKVPQIIQNTELFALDLGAMLAGTKYRGDFEKRLKGIMDELKSIPNAILFIDEIHTLIGAGSTSGTMDAANQLKPALASGELKCMGATTFAEYRNGFEKDKALSRRFSKVDINEPSVKTTYKILKGLKSKYEEHHNVTFTDKALKTAIELSKRYITDKFLPDKAIDLIDETAASFHLKNSKKRVVSSHDIENTISKIVGISGSKVTHDETLSLVDLEENLRKKVIGQERAVAEVTKAIKISKAGLTPQNKPIASFLFSGPTGVGKTELALSLSQILGINFERFDMSEYMEKHAISRLVGAPPGYVGYEQGGLLTEAIKRHPYTVLLLDEIEKAHPDLVNILLQIMDNATLTDNNGYKANFQNVILIMTSNIGATARSVMGFNKDSSLSKNEELKLFFTPEFRNRLDAIVEFNQLSGEVVKNIVNKFIDELNGELKKKKITISVSPKAAEYIAQSAYSVEMGARPIKRFIQDNITNKLSDEILFGKLKKGGSVLVSFNKNLILKFKEKDDTKTLKA